MEMNWLEVSLEVDGEAAEAVSEIFNRYGYGGVVLETIWSTNDSYRYHGRPIVRVKTYLPPDDRETQQKLEEALWFLRCLYPMPEPSFRLLAEDDWANAWKRHYQPIRIGEHFVVVPSWLTFMPESNDLIIELDPGMAFGTGLHPTTQMCLMALEQRMRPGLDVLDMGAGSGILSIAAARLGAHSVLAVEKDALAARIAAENVARNGVQHIVSVRTGSLEVVAGTFDVLCINILAEVIISLTHEGLLGHLRPGATFIAAGVVEDRADAVRAAFETHGGRIEEYLQEKDWVTLIGCVNPGQAF